MAGLGQGLVRVRCIFGNPANIGNPADLAVRKHVRVFCALDWELIKPFGAPGLHGNIDKSSGLKNPDGHGAIGGFQYCRLEGA